LSAGIGNVRVIVVDDNAAMRYIVTAMLKSIGIVDIRDFADGGAGLKSLETAQADIAIVDFRMKPTNGIDFTRLVRRSEDSETRFLPIIMLTGHADLARVLEARDAGVTELMVKPLTAQALISRLNAVITHPRPFVQTGHYFGPCRRRRETQGYAGPERRRTK
jgi:two-component system chemotaxis response regulator CheY